MATIDQDTRRMSRELRDLWRIRNYFAEEVQNRFSDSSFHGTGPQATKIAGYYFTLRIYLELFEVQYRETWRRLRKWSRDYAAIPDAFEGNLGPQTIQITRPMCTTNRLRNSQLNATITNEVFLSTGNRYENCWDVIDCFLDYLICFSLRLQGWSDIWDNRGSQPRFNRVVAILEDQRAIARTGATFVEDLCEEINTDKAAGVDELELRQNYSRRRTAIGTVDGEGGLYALNRGLTTAQLGGTIEPAEYNPDVETVRDFPALGTDV